MPNMDKRFCRNTIADIFYNMFFSVLPVCVLCLFIAGAKKSGAQQEDNKYYNYNPNQLVAEKAKSSFL